MSYLDEFKVSFSEKQNVIGSLGYYTTRREKIGVSHNAMNTEYIWGLYRALKKKYPDNVQEIDYSIGDFKQYAYVISTGDYSDKGLYQLRDGHDVIKKPKFLVMSGIDGHERKTVLSTYRFVRDLLRGHNVPQSFKEGAILHVMPVGCPWGFDAFVNKNENGIYVERNFDCEWEEKADGTHGKSAASENETKAIQKWLDDNKGADLFISYHNSGALNELVSIMGDSGNDATDMAKKIALRGVDRVIPYWRSVYPPKFKDVDYFDENFVRHRGERDTIFSYSASNRYPGTSVLYAQEKCGIPSFSIETPSYYGTSAEWEANDTVYQPEPIAAGAEAIGNILIEFYEQALSMEVNEDMKQIDSTLASLAESMESVGKGFRTESGFVEVPKDIIPGDATEAGGVITIPCSNGNVTVDDIIDPNTNTPISLRIRIPCSNGAKTIDFHADSDIRSEIAKTKGTRFVASYLANFYAPDSANASGKVDMGIAMKYVPELDYPQYNNGWLLAEYSGSGAKNDDGLIFPTFAVKAGTYEWTAYYWND